MKSIIIIIIVTGLSNMIADIFLVSGKNHKDDQTRYDQIAETPYQHLHISGVLGLLSIAFWVTSTVVGILSIFSFVMYIMSIQTFHVACSYVMICYKLNGKPFDDVGKVLKIYGAICILFSLIYTGSMIYLSVTGIISMSILQYITLPVFSMIIFQVVLRGILKKIPHYTSVAGTLGMMVSLLGTVSIFI